MVKRKYFTNTWSPFRTMSTGISFAMLCAISWQISQVSPVSGSSGDRNPSFTQCLLQCTYTGCTTAYNQPTVCSELCFVKSDSSSTDTGSYTGVLHRLRMQLWDCRTDCNYLCMHAVQAALLETYGKAITSAVKYHGKWPFHRALGTIQEPASVLFSLGNLLVHAHGAWVIMLQLGRSRRYTVHQRRTQPHKGPAFYTDNSRAACWLVYAALHMFAWLASAFLHTRDLRWTERLDYCAADVALAWGLLMSATRAALLLLTEQCPRKLTGKTTVPKSALAHLSLSPTAVVASVTVVLCACLTAQLYYLLAVKFDHEFNVRVGLVAGALQAILWVYVCMHQKHAGRRWLYMFLILLGLSALLEVGDFPPTQVLQLEVDAHALWHAATFLITPLLYCFVIPDICRGPCQEVDETQTEHAD